MKKILLASAATAAMTAAAYADGHEGGVTVTGDGRMGLVYDDRNDGNEFEFNSRIRIKFAASGQTDSGLAFGGEIRADNSGAGLNLGDDGIPGLTPGDFTVNGGGAAGQAGSVFISGEFGKLSMGDVDGAAKAAVGHVDGVGYTGLGDANESLYIAHGGAFLPKEAALYELDRGNFGFKASIGQPSEDGDEVVALGLKYTAGDYTFSLGYENNSTAAVDTDHIIIGADAVFGDITVKGRVGSADDVDQFALSGTYSAGGTAFTAFYNDIDDVDAVGLGASYDLGGGASLKGGLVQRDDGTNDATVADFGMTFDF